MGGLWCRVKTSTVLEGERRRGLLFSRCDDGRAGAREDRRKLESAPELSLVVERCLWFDAAWMDWDRRSAPLLQLCAALRASHRDQREF